MDWRDHRGCPGRGSSEIAPRAALPIDGKGLKVCWILCQVGDILDRGDDEVAINYWLERLEREAMRAGGALYILNGNHEVLQPLDPPWCRMSGAQQRVTSPHRLVVLKNPWGLLIECAL